MITGGNEPHGRTPSVQGTTPGGEQFNGGGTGTGGNRQSPIIITGGAIHGIGGQEIVSTLPVTGGPLQTGAAAPGQRPPRGTHCAVAELTKVTIAAARIANCKTKGFM